MRWKPEIYALPKSGDIREVWAFLILPKCLPVQGAGQEEVRWFEFAKILQRYTMVGCGDGGGECWHWKNESFVNV